MPFPTHLFTTDTLEALRLLILVLILLFCNEAPRKAVRL